MSNLRLPHWAFIALGILGVVVPWLMNAAANGTLVLPASVMTILTILRTVIGLLTPSVNPSTNVEAVKRASLRPGPHPGPIVGMFCLVLGVVSLDGCGFLAAAVPGIINVVDAECARAKEQPSTPGWIDFLCTIAKPAPGEAATFTYRVKADDAPQFAAMHAPKGAH